MEQLRRVISEFGRRIIEHPEQLKAAFAELGGAPGVSGKRFDAVLVASRTGVAARIRDSESASPERVDEWVHTLTHAGCARADAVAAIADWGDALGAVEVPTIARGLGDAGEADVVVAERAAPVEAAAPPMLAAPTGNRDVLREWRPALLSGAALLVGLAVLIPILAVTSARPAAAEVKDEPSGLFQAGDLPQFILNDEQLQSILPTATPVEPTPQLELPDPPVTTDPVNCAAAYLSVPGPTSHSSGPYGLAIGDGQFSLSSTARFYATLDEAQLAFDGLLPPGDCTSFQLNTGQVMVPVVYSTLSERTIAAATKEGAGLEYLIDSQTILSALTITRVCGIRVNVVACVQLQGPGAAPFEAILAAEDSIAEQFLAARPFEIPASAGGER